MSKNEASKVSITLYIEKSGEFAHIKGHVCSPALNDGQYLEYGHPLSKLVICSQISRQSTPNRLYGWELAMSTYDRTTSEEAREAIALLTPIEKRMEKMQEAEGFPQTFSQFANRIARAIKAQSVFIRRDANDPHRYGNKYREYTVGDAVQAVAQMESELVDWSCPQAKAA